MDKKYYADVYFYVCPKCQRQVLGKMYFGVFQKSEIGATKLAGLITYRCPHPGCGHSSNHQLVNGEVVEVSPQEALSSGLLVFDSKGSA
jgi:hypothetical protein